MLIEIILAITLGILAGIITGLIPGIHVNLITVIVLSFSTILLKITDPTVIAIFIISLAITHSFLDALPSIYLGAPDAGQELNVLPGHRLLHKGEGHNAIIYTVIGSFGCLILCILLFPVFVMLMKIIAPFMKNIVGYLLAIIMIFMIAREKRKWAKSLTVFLLAGVLGLLVLTGIPNLNQPLFPLLSGLFGFSLLIVSLTQNAKIPEQKEKPLQLKKKTAVKAISAASSVGFIAAFLPGFGNSQAAIAATQVVGDIGDSGFLSLVGGINTANMVLSIGTVYMLDKARNGAIVGVKNLLGTVNLQQTITFLFVALIVGSIATILTIKLSKIFAKNITKVNYGAIIWCILIFITTLTFFFDGIIGILILLTATSLGLVTTYWKIGKNHLMGCLILPVILFFLL